MRRSMLWALAACAPTRPSIDVTAPKVVSVVPAQGAVNVSLQASLQICFDSAMQAQSLATAITLTRKIGTHKSVTAVAVSMSADESCASLAPTTQLSPTASYALDVSRAALSADGVSLSHTGTATVAFTSGFTTAAPLAEVSLLVPTQGALNAPLNLADVFLAFSRPVQADRPAFSLSGGAQGTVLDGGWLASANASGLSAGSTVSVALSPRLLDLTGRAPATPPPLAFTMGSCSEGSAPSVGGGTSLVRDRDGFLVYATDRPCLCSAQFTGESCPTASAVEVPASCGSPYDPCQSVAPLCICQVPLVGLCPSDSFQLAPAAIGWNGQTGTAASGCVQTAPALPPLVLNELMLLPTAGHSQERYLEIVNTGDAPLDCLGLVIADCGNGVGCAYPRVLQAFGPFTFGGSTVLAAHAYALLVDGAFDPTQFPDLPNDVLLLAPLDQTPLLHLTTTAPEVVALFPAGGAAPPLSTFDGSLIPLSGLSVERVDPAAADSQPGNWAVGLAPGGTPGICNSVTPGASCAEQ